MTAAPPSGYGALASRLLGFSALPFFALILPMIALPIVSRTASTGDWAALNVGLGAGAVAAAIGLVGWNLLGTPLVAMAETTAEQHALYGRSFYIRLTAVTAASVVTAVVAGLISPAAWQTAAVFAVAAALNGINLSWYAVGVADPRLILWYEVVPRTVATAAAIAVVLLTGQVVWYGLLLCLSVVVGTALFHRRLLGRFLPLWPGARALRSDVADMASAWGTESITGLYANGPVPIAGAVASTSAASAFASSDRIYRYGLLGVIAVGNALQGWVLETSGAQRRTRNSAALVLMGVIALIGWVVLAIFGPALSGLIFGANKQGDPLVFHFYAIAFVSLTMATPLIRNVLIPARRDRHVFIVSVIAGAIGVSTMIGLGLGTPLGIVGVGIGFALSETISFAACLILALGVARTQRREGVA